MNLPAFTKQPLFRGLALVVPLVLMLVLGIRAFKPVEALGAAVTRGPVTLDIRGTGTLDGRVPGQAREAAREAGEKVQQQEARRAVQLLGEPAHVPQRPHSKEQVRGTEVEEARRQQAPGLAAQLALPVA